MTHRVYQAKHFDLSASTGTYVTEISQLQTNAPETFTLQDCPKPGESRNFKRVGIDRTPDGEDIAGWRYQEQGGNLKALVIND